MGPLVQETKGRIDFQDSGPLEFQIRTILAIFYLQAAPLFPTKFQVSWPFGSEEKSKSHFQPIGMILPIFDL